MKLLALADIHGGTDGVASILQRVPEFDVLVLAGDLTTHGTRQEAERLLLQLIKPGKPVFTVAGNMDDPSLAHLFERTTRYIDGKGMILDDVGFFGVSGSTPTPFGTPWERSEEEMSRTADAGWRDIVGACRRVFVPHTPPKHTACDRTHIGFHAGSQGIRSFIEPRQPDLVICGTFMSHGEPI